MHYKNTIEIILQEIQSIENIVEGFHKKEHIPNLDLDLVLDKMRNTYDLFLMIREAEGEASQDVEEPSASDQESSPEHDVHFPEQEESPVEEVKGKYENKKIPDDTKTEEDTHVSKSIKEEESDFTEPENKETTKEEEKNEKKKKEDNKGIIADRFQHNQFVNESIRKKNPKQDLSSKMELRPISDIKKAIGVNDKFLFINELFGGDPNLYNRNVDWLNQLSSYKEAEEYLKKHFNWNWDQQVVQDFIKIIKRKYL